MKIATLSSKKLGDSYEGALKNNYLYNDKELFDDADLNWYDYGFRNYDPQIGRFTQLDPLTHEFPYYTPYQYAGCEPIANIDLDGLEPYQMLEGIVLHSTRKAGSVDKLSKIISGASKVSHAVFTTLDVYSNSRGNTFSEPNTFGSTPSSSQCYLGEEWTFTGTRMETYYVGASELPFSASYTGTTVSAKKLRWLARQYNFFSSPKGRMISPNLSLIFEIVNDGTIAYRTLFSASTGISKNDVQDLGGNPTTFDQRYMAGIGTLSIPMTMGLGSAETQVASRVTRLNPYKLEMTHGLTKSRGAFSKLKTDILANGIKEPLKFVVHNEKKYLVDGHHRLRVAKELGFQNVPVQQVKLPYAGYKKVDDLIYSRY